ncbi:hypothetical protein H2248_001752 [Termitomyces sp. 'cryptogamus']|nr:hypothetical protein H2248_001752 [Termitomyces sp. 'cryptogamus']
MELAVFIVYPKRARTTFLGVGSFFVSDVTRKQHVRSMAQQTVDILRLLISTPYGGSLRSPFFNPYANRQDRSSHILAERLESNPDKHEFSSFRELLPIETIQITTITASNGNLFRSNHCSV